MKRSEEGALCVCVNVGLGLGLGFLQGFWPVAVRRDRRVSVSPAPHSLGSLVPIKLKHGQKTYVYKRGYQMQ